MVNITVVRERLANIAEYVEDLRTKEKITFTEYLNDKVVRRFIEHTLQIAVEACIDIGHHIIAAKHFEVPKERRDIFTIMVREGILPEQLLPTLYKMVGYRNLVVHEYEKVNKELVFGTLKKNLGDFDQFRQCIYEFLDREEANSKSQLLDSDQTSDRTAREPRARYTIRKRKPAKRHAR